LVHLYINRCWDIGRRYELVTEELFKQALDLAKKRDYERKIHIDKGTEKELPFFHGIPMSVKDCYSMKGCLSTIGCAMKDLKEKTNSHCVEPFLKAGAIPIVRGNMP
jgi:Asp-tRNA(Asn)/Glu-tRNA(Gln) amidotransferase A subunit family amidase